MLEASYPKNDWGGKISIVVDIPVMTISKQRLWQLIGTQKHVILVPKARSHCLNTEIFEFWNINMMHSTCCFTIVLTTLIFCFPLCMNSFIANLKGGNNIKTRLPVCIFKKFSWISFVKFAKVIWVTNQDILLVEYWISNLLYIKANWCLIFVLFIGIYWFQRLQVSTHWWYHKS